MMLRNTLKYGLACWLFIALVAYGCASVGKFTPQGAVVANNAVTVATGLLHVLDGFYGNLLTLQAVPGGFTTEATRALSIADAAAIVLRSAISGTAVSQEQLNVAAGQVEGSRLMMKSILRGSI